MMELLPPKNEEIYLINEQNLKKIFEKNFCIEGPRKSVLFYVYAPGTIQTKFNSKKWFRELSEECQNSFERVEFKKINGMENSMNDFVDDVIRASCF